MSDDAVKTCQGCGASIYPEHIQRGKAGYSAGKLLCAVCFKESHPAAHTEAVALVQPSEVTSTAGTAQKISSTPQGGRGAPGASHEEGPLARPLLPNAANATRCRTFHAKLNEGALAYMNGQINQWADSNENITIKFCTSTIGVFEGKHADPHLILTVFY